MKMDSPELEKIRNKTLKIMKKTYGENVIEETVSDSSTIFYHMYDEHEFIIKILRIKIEEIIP